MTNSFVRNRVRASESSSICQTKHLLQQSKKSSNIRLLFALVNGRLNFSCCTPLMWFVFFLFFSKGKIGRNTFVYSFIAVRVWQYIKTFPLAVLYRIYERMDSEHNNVGDLACHCRTSSAEVWFTTDRFADHGLCFKCFFSPASLWIV